MEIQLHIFDKESEYVTEPIELTNILPIGTKIFDYEADGKFYNFEVWQISYSIEADKTICYANECDNHEYQTSAENLEVCVMCDKKKEVHNICVDCLTKIINENKQT